MRIGLFLLVLLSFAPPLHAVSFGGVGALVAPPNPIRLIGLQFGTIAPPSGLSDIEETEWYIGVIVASGELCGYYSKAAEVRSFMKLSPHFQQALTQMNQFRMAQGCSRYEGYLDDVLARKSYWERHVKTAYLKRTPTQRNERFTEATDKALCRVATTGGGSRWETREAWLPAVEEARRRRISLSECSVLRAARDKLQEKTTVWKRHRYTDSIIELNVGWYWTKPHLGKYGSKWNDDFSVQSYDALWLSGKTTRIFVSVERRAPGSGSWTGSTEETYKLDKDFIGSWKFFGYFEISNIVPIQCEARECVFFTAGENIRCKAFVHWSGQLDSLDKPDVISGYYCPGPYSINDVEPLNLIITSINIRGSEAKSALSE